MGRKSKPGYPIPKMKINWNAKYPSQPQPAGLEEYYLTDRNCAKQRICPNCNSQLVSRSYNIPIYNENEEFYAYHVHDLLFCSRCHQTFMTDSVLSDIEAKLVNSRQHVKPSNVHVKRSPHSGRYLYLPISDYEIYFERRTRKNKERAQITSLADSSFLSDEGYNTNLERDARISILKFAVKKYGLRRVADHLRFLIDTRMGQENGVSKYAKAIDIWRQDLNFITRLNL